ncbi:MAG: putative addiction module antidote protein [Candidatus Riflebacteria bacterium]|nr:putative addiction module antidote protein [Candidatus Riflebacteria bacterium]
MKLSKWDMSDNIKTQEDAYTYLQVAFEEGNVEDIINVLNAIARAKGMTKIAKNLGVGRESLYKSLSSDGNPSFTTIIKLLSNLGLSLTIKAKES